MKLNVFKKVGKAQDGREFPIYLSTLSKKDGSEIKVAVKFRQDAPQFDGSKCPCVIDVDKKKASLAVKNLFDSATGDPLVDVETGELKKSKTLWVSDWTYIGPYEDHSLDDFED